MLDRVRGNIWYADDDEVGHLTGYYFEDEVQWLNGPYDTIEAAEEALRRYSDELLGNSQEPQGMQITTALKIGDTVWAFRDGKAHPRTVGHIRIFVTDPDRLGDSWSITRAPQIEEYMCVETGLGSGSVYTLGDSIFRTEKECLDHHADEIAAQKRKKILARREERALIQNQIKVLRQQLKQMDEREEDSDES